MEIEAVEILGVRVHRVTTAQALALLDAYVREGTPHQVVTVNPEFLIRAQSDAAFRQVLQAADLALPDGQGLLWAARVLGQPLPERVTGSDTVPALAEAGAQKGYRLFLLGAGPDIAQRAGQILAARHPGLKIVGAYAGSPAPEEEAEIVARVRAALPDFLLVAYGAPQQDLWIRRNLTQLGAPVCMGVGGTLDFIAGVTPRAPLWMRRHGLEWLFRLWIQPWRWRRMLALPKFVVQVLWHKWLRA